MDSRNRNRTIRYEGGANLWQGANRIQADVVDIDREKDKKVLVADGHVITNLWEEPKDEAKKKTATPVLTEVHAGHMVYTEESRLTHYTGGTQLNRPGLQVKSKELRAFLAESGADSRVEKAYADGAVEIFSSGKDLHPHRHRRACGILHGRPEGDPARTVGEDGGKGRHRRRSPRPPRARN